MDPGPVKLHDVSLGLPLPPESVDLIMCSSPYYYLRDYRLPASKWPDGSLCCLGVEDSVDLYLDHLLFVMEDCRRVLKKSGTLWVNIGDSHGGSGRGRGGIDKRPVGIGTTGNTKQTKGYEKSLLCIPERFAVAMVQRGWILRNKIIWVKQILLEDGLSIGSCMPASAKDRFTVTFEPLYFFTKSQNYYFDLSAVRVKDTCQEGLPDGVVRSRLFDCDTKEKILGSPGPKRFNYRVRDARKKEGYCPQFRATDAEVAAYNNQQEWRDNPTHADGKNPGSSWQINPRPTPVELHHFATYPEALCVRPILAGSPPGGLVLDPFCGIGTTGVVAIRYGRQFVGYDLSPENVETANAQLAPLLAQTNLFDSQNLQAEKRDDNRHAGSGTD